MMAGGRLTGEGASRRPLLMALGAVACIDVLTAMVVLAYGNAYLLRTLHAAPSAPAFALTTYGLVKLLAAPIAGPVVDHARTRTILIGVAAIELAALAIILATHSTPGYFVGVGGLAAGIATSWILAIRALGAAIRIGDRGVAAAYMSMVSGVATGVGFGVAAVVSETGPWWLPFALGVFVALGSVVLLRRRRSDVPLDEPTPSAAEARATADQMAAAITPFGRIAAASVIFAHFSVMTALLVVFWPFALSLLGLSPLRAALLLVPAAMCGVLVLVVSGRVSRRGQRLRQAAALYALGAGGMAVMAGATNALWFAGAAVLVAPALAGAQPMLMASMIDISHLSRRSGTALGWLFSAEGLGGIAGPALVGIVIELSGVRTAMVAIALGTVLLAGITAAASRIARL